jgi:hypothetical protein
MRFLIKAAFWLTVVVMLLPSEKRSTAPQIGAGEAVSAANAAMSDMRQFCARQKEACAVGSQAAAEFGHKAQSGAKMLYELLNDRTGPNETGTLAAKPAARAAQPSQQTLTPADLAPPWRAPESRRDAKPPA